MARRRWSRAEEERVIALVEKCSRSRRKLLQVHSHVIVYGARENNYIAAKLVRALAELNNLQDARRVFDAMPAPNEFLWNALIWGYSRSSARESCLQALSTYSLMHRSCFSFPRPLAFTISSALKACAKLEAMEGEQIHAHAFKFGFQFDARVQTSLVDLYGSFRRVSDARRVFDSVVLDCGGRGDAQVWNTMISGYCLSGDMVSARNLFEEMPLRNTFTWVEMIKGYAAAGNVDDLERIMEELDLVKEHVVDRVVIFTAATSGFLMCGQMTKAQKLFDKMPDRDVAAWNAMISGYTSAGRGDLALELFNGVLESSVKPNAGTIVAAAAAAAQSGSAESARRVSNCVEEGDTAELLNSRSAAALIDMHAKCGDLRLAWEVFRQSKCKDLVCYSTMIASLGVHGKGEEAIQIFHELIDEGLKPDGVCFVSVLAACSHAGLVDEGRRVFELMNRDHGISPAAEHYVCMVDMLGRAGRIQEAWRIIVEEMAPAVGDNRVVWGALLSACRSHREVAVAEAVAQRLIGGELCDWEAGTPVVAARQLIEEDLFDQAVRRLIGGELCDQDAAAMRRKIGEESCDLNMEAGELIEEALCSRNVAVVAARQPVEEEFCGFLPGEVAGKAGDYVLLANVYAGAGRWEDTARVRAVMRRRGVRKLPGWSCLDSDGHGKMEKFLTGQVSEHLELEPVLKLLVWDLSGEGLLFDLPNEIE